MMKIKEDKWRWRFWFSWWWKDSERIFLLKYILNLNHPIIKICTCKGTRKSKRFPFVFIARGLIIFRCARNSWFSDLCQALVSLFFARFRRFRNPQCLCRKYCKWRLFSRQLPERRARPGMRVLSILSTSASETRGVAINSSCSRCADDACGRRPKCSTFFFPQVQPDHFETWRI